MLRATSVLRKAAVKPERVIETVTLDHEGRHRRRMTLTGIGGLEFLMDLEKATVLADGDALKLEDGRLVQVKAAPQKLLEIRAENPLRLLRVAWHVGNRHTPAEITADALYIEEDHVLAEMVRGQGCSVVPVERPFQPEKGAYDHGGHGHDHHGHGHEGHGHEGHDHHGHGDHGHGDHGHAHGHAGHGHDHAGHAHAHGDACGCGHDHGHAHDHDHAGHSHAEHGHAGHGHAGHGHAGDAHADDHKHGHDHVHAGHGHKHG